jgi:diguanylate cyclase (GGDEF)-like protein
LSLIDALNETAQGRVIFQQVEHAMRDQRSSQNKIIYGYAAILQVILDSYRRHLPSASLLNLELKLVQKRLQPPISLNELAILHAYIKNVTTITTNMLEPDEKIIREALKPLMGEIQDEHDLEQSESTAQMQQPIAQATQQPNHAATSPSVELRVDSLFRQRLSKHYQEIQNLQSVLMEKIDKSAAQYNEFGKQLEKSIHQLEDANADEVTLEQERRSIARSIRNLLSNKIDLALILEETQAYLSMVGSNSQKLSDELDQVRVLSLTDDVTGLPNRRAFLRRAEDEMGRSQRDKTPLAIVAIDLDLFKNINDQYGHSVGDEILRIYAKDVLSIFRRYDMVCRYGGEEFAVLLPNTDITGALRALHKIQTKVSKTFYELPSEHIPLPTFSAGLVIHRPGESMQSLIDRADSYLYKAKQRGRNRIEIDERFIVDEAELENASVEQPN